ncbi:hypothetical protein Celaphus_00019558 [Cervus elaphus hippelaphus]|uniref:Kinesin-like protein n=1 Tax=Cervus elaphus hippelaphus TaxID=46360 RepID=A0A212C363_CEREH|nr:hypothetical protein Celaphus_00019558 [Cervus elaphus hippelaphus]
MERWRLHNQLQELKGTIRVFCRSAPSFQGSPPHPLASSSFPLAPRYGALSGVPAAPTGHDFPFDRVFSPGSRQDEVFEEISTLVHSALDDDPTGSGKTFTREGGPGGDAQMEGLISWAPWHLFSLAQELSGQGWTYSFVASLLATGTREGQGGECVIGQAGPGRARQGQAARSLRSPTRVMFWPPVRERLALQNRAVARTAQNERSLRSHGVFQLQISGEDAGRGLQCLAPLSLVDLAGNEQLDPGLSLGPGEWEHLRETLAINSGLSTLGLVIMALSNKESHWPYGNSKLTYLLQNSLGGSAEMLMFMNISPLKETVSKSLNSLHFASKVNQCIIGTAQVNKK